MMGLVQGFRDLRWNKLPDWEYQEKFVDSSLLFGDVLLARSLVNAYHKMTILLKDSEGSFALETPLKDFGESVAGITQEQLQSQWVLSMAENRLDSLVRRLGVQFCKEIDDVVQRDKVIFRACTDEDTGVRNTGFNQLMFVSDRSVFRQLAKKYPKEAERVLGLEMEQRAQEMATQMRTFYKQNALVRQALDETYGGEEYLPGAEDIKNQFSDIAIKFLRPQQPWYRRWLGLGVPRDQVIDVRHLLLHVASETGSYMAIGIKPEHVSIIKEVYDKRVEVETKLSKTKHLFADQLMIQAQADQQFTDKTNALAKAKKAFVDAGKDKEKRDEEKFQKAYTEMRQAEEQLKDAEEKLKQSQTGTTVTQHHVRQLTQQLRVHHAKLSQAIQSSVMGANYQEMRALVDSSEATMADPAMEKIFEAADLQVAMVMVEKEQLDAQRGLEKLKADILAKEMFEQETASPALQADASQKSMTATA